MKKYVKPELFYERFELSQHIADCQWELKFANGVCIAEADPDYMGNDMLPLFASSNTNCGTPADETQNYCYQPGMDHLPKVAVS